MPVLLVLAALMAAGSPPAPFVPRNPDQADEVMSGKRRVDAAALLEQAVQATGGAAAVDGVRNLDMKSTGTRQTSMGEIEIKQHVQMALPDRMRQEIALPFALVTTVLTRGGAFVLSGQNTVPLPEGEFAALRGTLRRNLIALLQRRHDSASPPLYAGFAHAGPTFVNVVNVGKDLDTTAIGIDPETGHVLLLTFNSAALGGMIQITYSDYRAVGGIRYPFSAVGTAQGQPLFSTRIEEVVVNPSLPDTLFEAPPPPSPASSPSEPRP